MLFFVREIARRHSVVCTLSETRRARPPFETQHPFEAERDRYETLEFFDGKNTPLSETTPTLSVEDVNEPQAIEALIQAAPDVVVVFGTGLIRQPLIDQFKNRIINLHGGDPEEYRGLDSHLWAIYHGDFDGLISTLHHVNSKLDDGEIIGRKILKPKRGSELIHLRAVNTRACVQLVLEALDSLQTTKKMAGTPQKKRGRYYSFMPTPLKEICVKRFKKFAESLE
jgi:methionyl-tRNA formyltransferase